MKQTVRSGTGPKRVLLFLPGGGENELRLLAGVRDAAKARKWDLSVAECLRRKDGALKFIRSPGGGTVGELLDGLRPDGVLVMFQSVPPSALRRPGRALPVVFVDRPAEADALDRATLVCLFGEASSYAQLAAEELFRSGFRDYAFLPWPGDPPWSRQRGDAFERLVAEAGFAFHPFRPSRGGAAADLVTHLAPFLASIPKPCGVFAANDILGEAALRVCRKSGRTVPQDLAVVGVDNLEFVCEATSPTLSSVARDWEGEGRAAADLLADWMADPRRRPASRAVPPLRVVRRASTFVSTDPRIARAMEFIRLHACEAGFAPPAVAREMGLGRSQTDLLFRTVEGRSVLAAIHAARLARAQDLLRAGKSAAFAADVCGYASLVDFRRVFRRRVGSTVRAWTLAARTAAP